MRHVRRAEGGYTGLFVALAVVVVLAATAGTVVLVRADDPKQATQVQGSAYLGEPLAGATVQLTDSDGEEISTEEEQTSESGSFLVEVNDLPASFQVTVSGGAAGDSIFAGTLRAEVRNADARLGPIRVNAVTTLAAEHLDASENVSLDEAERDVKAFLEIPENLNITSDLVATDEFFSHDNFLEQSASAGGFDGFISDLAASMGTETSRAFPGEAENSLATGAAEFLAKKLLDRAAGEILKKYGLQDADTQIIAELAELKQQVTAIQGQLVALDGRIGKALGEIARNGYQNLATQIPITSIKDSQQELIEIAGITDPKARSARAETLMGTLGRLNLDLVAHNINDLITGGMIRSYFQTFTSDNFLTRAESLAVRAAYDYYDTLQVSAINLWVEYVNATEDPKDDASIPGTLRRFEERRVAQYRAPAEGGVVPDLIPWDGYVFDTETAIMWINRQASLDGYGQSGPNNSGRPTPTPNSTTNTCSQVSPCFHFNRASEASLKALVAARGDRTVGAYLSTTALAGASPGNDWLWMDTAEYNWRDGRAWVMDTRGGIHFDCCLARSLWNTSQYQPDRNARPSYIGRARYSFP